MKANPLESAAFLSWDESGRIIHVGGNFQGALGVALTPRTLTLLGELLGIPALPDELTFPSPSAAKTTRFLRGVRSGLPVTYRAQLGAAEGGIWSAELLNITALLEGAPPLQIAALASSLSHEIRNPLSSVKMTVQTLARNAGLSERDLRRLTIANREIRTIERMLALLSEYGRNSDPHLTAVALRSLVQEAAATVEAELAERQATLLFDEDPTLPKVSVDPNRCRPVIAQLLLNIASGAEAGGPLSVWLGRTGGAIGLRVEDRSSLLSEDRVKLFEPFGSRLARGAGLSLAALRQVMLSQGGGVTAEPGEVGTVFTLTFEEA